MNPTPPPLERGARRVPPSLSTIDAPVFHREKHISYWLRCLRSPLPRQYTSNDSNRMTLAFFTVSALDLLGVLHSRISQEEREDYIQWIYSCQHPEGGFRAFPGTDFGDRRDDSNKVWDPANLPATYFALSSLCILGDDLQRLQRQDCLRWLKRMQRLDGSFGQTLGEDGCIEGGMDTRFGYCAMAVRWIVRGDAEGPVEDVPDVDLLGLGQCIRGSETYDGGMSDEPFHEAHAGFTYCAIGALYFLDGLPTPRRSTRAVATERQAQQPGLASADNTVRWLLSRLVTTIEEERSDDEDTEAEEDTSANAQSSDGFSSSAHESQTPSSSFSSNDDMGKAVPVHSFEKPGSTPGPLLKPRGTESGLLINPTAQSLSSPRGREALNMPSWAGFNGRTNKLADTCYAFWVGGSLDILHSLQLVDAAPIRRFLLEKTQHPIMGGFGKHTGTLPDMFHAYFGLAALSLLGIADITREGEGLGAKQGREQHPLPATEPSLMEHGGHVHGTGKEHQSSVLEAAEVSQRREVDGKIDDWSEDHGRTLRRFDAALCISHRARQWIDRLHE